MRSIIRHRLDEAPWLPLALQRRLRHTFLARDGSSWPSFYFDNFYSAFTDQAQQELLTDGLGLAPGAAYRNSLEYWDQSSGDLLHRLLYTDIKTYLVELLMKQDNMSMAASRKPRAVSRSCSGGIYSAYPRILFHSQAGWEVYSQRGCQGAAAAVHYLPQKDGIPHTAAGMADGIATGCCGKTTAGAAKPRMGALQA